VLPIHLSALRPAERRRVLQARVGDLIDELDLTGLVVVDGRPAEEATSPTATPVTDGELIAACRAACASRPQVVDVRWSEATEPRAASGARGAERPGASTIVDAILDRLDSRPAAVASGSGAWRMRVKFSLRGLAEQLWGHLPPAMRKVAERMRTRRGGGGDRVPVPVAGMLSDDEAAVAVGVAVVLRGKAAGSEAGATLEALRRHQLVHRDVRPLLVWEPGVEAAALALVYPSEVLPAAGGGAASSTRQRRRLSHLREVYELADVLVLEGAEDLDDPVTRSSLERLVVRAM
jgi:hypothetical protein